MFTHISPEIERQNTASSIRRESKISISRAINLKRLIAFTGSGTSSIFGLPAWSELPRFYADCLNKQIAKAIEPTHEESESSFAYKQRKERLVKQIKPTLEQINAITNGENIHLLPGEKTAYGVNFTKPFDGDVLTFFSLCDDVLKSLPDDSRKGLNRLYLARKDFGQTVRVGEAKILHKKLGHIIGAQIPKPKHPTNNPQSPKYGRFLGALDHIRKTLSEKPDLGEWGDGEWQTLNEITEPEQNSGVYGSELERNNQDSERDIIKVLMSNLGIGRFATLNYDVQIERQILKDQQMIESDEAEAFRDLCDETKPLRPHQKRLVIESGVKMGAMSATLDHNNIAEVVNFSAYSKRFARQVMHLHGRYDDPGNLILTADDYRNLYELKSIARDSFSNAQRTLFDGNDVLFIGIGMTEDEINRQLKRFLTSEHDARNNARRAFLLYSAHSCGKCFEEKKACNGCIAKDEALILDKYNQLGVHSIVYGGPKYRAISGFLSKHGKIFQEFSANWDADDSPRAFGEAVKIFGATVSDDDFKARAVVEAENGKCVHLLTKVEIKFVRSFFKKLLKQTDDLPSCGSKLAALAGALLQELCGRVMSRAACAELKKLKENADRWWEEWNAQPFERRAIYHMANKKVSGKENYLWIRHCPVTKFKDPIKPKNWPVLRAARKSVKAQVAHQRSLAKKRGGKRQLAIARFAIERGRGQGSFVRLILQKSVQQHLFHDTAQGQHPVYAAAFVAYLSFSMEFSSVTKALTRFVARRVAVLQTRHPLHKSVKKGLNELVKKEIEPLNHAGRSTQEKNISFGRLLKDLAHKERAETDTLVGKLQKLQSNESNETLTKNEMQQLAQALFVSRRETEPRLLDHPEKLSFKELSADVERRHRLDVLRDILLKYQDLATSKQHIGKERIFICLGGLDRLCDADGDAHNPMHRALFRLLTGTYEHKELDVPIDIVLLSGKPNAPICFLSTALRPKKVKRLKPHQYKLYSRNSKTRQYLCKWDQLDHLSWAGRIALAPSFFGKKDFEDILDPQKRQTRAKKGGCDQAAFEFIEWARKRDASSLALTSDSGKVATGLHRMLWKNVGLTAMLYACWERAFTMKYEQAQENGAHHFMKPFEQSFNRDQENGVLAEIFKWYRRNTDKHDGSVDVLHDLVLRHLVLYALPIEPWVLLNCPRIYRALLNEFDLAKKPNNSTGNHPERDEWIECAWMLDRLRDVLNELRGRGMVIRIHCSSFSESHSTDDEAFLHHRFSLHGRIREFIAYRMQLNIFDQGDVNHHQISLYCNQPRDLPTPSPLHFQMIEGILNDQRDENRKTLELTYRHSKTGRTSRTMEWDPSDGDLEGRHRTKQHSKEAASRIFAYDKINQHEGIPEKFADKGKTIKELGGSLGRMHAVSQRVRGNFSLVRSAFSVGSLSRMDAAPSVTNDVPPFELYRSWLRSILNAAVGLRVNNVELSGVFDGTLVPKWVEKDDLRQYSKRLKLFRKELLNAKGGRDLEKCRKEAKLTFDELGIGPLEVNRGKDTGPDRLLIAAARDSIAILKQVDKLELHERQTTSFKRVRHPLYRDEIAWLYNERALTSLIQGRVFDAIPLFRKARDVMSHKVTPESDTKAFNAVERRINLNHAVAKIERGKIRDARLILEDLKRSSASVRYSTPSRLVPYVVGYSALCDHLGGSFETARTGYINAISKLWRSQDLRAVAIFKRHLADLYRAIGDLDLAQNEIQLAINAASQAQQRDVLNLAYSSRAQIYLSLGKKEEVEESLPHVLDYAEKMGLYSNRSDALMVEARLRIKNGDLGPAADAAAESIALCTRNGQRLRKLSSLITYGGIQYLREQHDIARTILENAKAEAEQIGYQLKAADASRAIAQQGRPDPPVVNFAARQILSVK